MQKVGHQVPSGNLVIMGTKCMTDPSVAKDGYTSTDPAEGADQELQDLGYAPELARTKSTVGIICMTFILTAMPYGSSSSLYYPLINGGSSTVVWGFLLVSLIMVCLAASLAEITSVYPTAGGVYYQTFMLGSLQWRRIAAWICGWSFVLGTVIICLSVGFGFTLYLIACVNVFDTSDGSPFWEPETYQVFLIFLAFTLLCNATSVLGNARLHILDVSSSTFYPMRPFADPPVNRGRRNGAGSARYDGLLLGSGQRWPSFCQICVHLF